MRSSATCNVQPSLPRRSAAKAGPGQSNRVQVSQTQSNLCEADVRPTSNPAVLPSPG